MKPANARYEILDPDRKPADQVTYRETAKPEPDLVANAEAQMNLISGAFGEWLCVDCAELQAAWKALRHTPDDSDLFLRFHGAIHTISGNAELLGNTTAGQLALPLARLIDRTPRIKSHIPMIDAAVHAISATIARPDETSPAIEEIRLGLETIVARWIDG